MMLLWAFELEAHANSHETAQLMMLLLNLLEIVESMALLRTIMYVSHSVSRHEFSQLMMLLFFLQMHWETLKEEEGTAQ